MKKNLLHSVVAFHISLSFIVVVIVLLLVYIYLKPWSTLVVAEFAMKVEIEGWELPATYSKRYRNV